MTPLAENQKPLPEKTPREVELQKALDALRGLFNGVEEKQKLAAALANQPKRPRGWSNRANAPYFKERFALEFKVVLDAMMQEFATGVMEDREYKYSEFPELSRNSLYLKVNQSKLYLLTKLDFDGSYTRFCENLTITRERTGVRISYCRDVHQGKSFTPEKVIPKQEQDITIKDKIEKFLDEAKDGEKLTLNKLSLSEEEQNDIHASLCQLTHIVYDIKPSSVVVLKVSDDDWTKLNQ